MFKRKTVKINVPHVIKASKKQFHDLARSFKRTLETKQHYKIGDRIRIKEHDGRKYTGREIAGQITAIEKGRIVFKKFSITHDEALEKQNDADSRRHYNFEKYN